MLKFEFDKVGSLLLIFMVRRVLHTRYAAEGVKSCIW